jgi:selenophosphate synthetase-related protein
LPAAAEAGWCDAARDISMAGVIGSLLMMLELSGVGAVMALDDIPIPRAAVERYFDWLLGFPSYGFVLSARPQYVAALQTSFGRYGITCASIGVVTLERQVYLRRGGEEQLLFDLDQESFMGLACQPAPAR